METLTKKPEITLNEDQLKALETMNSWLYADKSNVKAKDDTIFFALTGAAGTGKTTLIATFLKELVFPIKPHRVCVCAPTHKAKKVIREKTNWNNSETLQALLGLKMDVSLEDFDVNNPAFSPIGDRKIKDYDLVVIDESSMINTDLYITITDCAKSTGTKILFVGDIKQLNPVKEYTISPALLTPINKYNLTQIVRQGNTNPLIILLDIIRQDIENETSNYIQYMIDNPVQYNDKGEGYACVNRDGFAKALTEGFTSEEFKQDKNHCRYICWTNKGISDTNRWIRDSILGSKETFIVGELLLSYKTLAADDRLVLVNSDDYMVLNIDTIDANSDEYNISTYYLKLQCIDTGEISRVPVVQPNQGNYDRFIEVHNDLLDTAKRQRSGRAWKAFYNFRDAYILLEPLTTNQYGKAVLVAKKDIDYGYGITIHKSQGSTYNTVYVNGADINKNVRQSEKLRLWYVALSRASNKAIINI